MSFRNPNSPPVCYLIRPDRGPTTCILLHVQGEELALQPEGDNPCQVGEVVHLSIDPRVTDLDRCISGQVLGVDGDTMTLGLRDPDALWASAQTANTFNRRQAFRVSTLDLLPHRGKSEEEVLHITLQHGGQTLEAEMLDLSLTGCGLRVRSRHGSGPDLGSKVFVEISGADLPEALRVPAQVERHRERGRFVHLGLAFLQGENRFWVQAEAQISAYLVQRQLGRAHRDAA